MDADYTAYTAVLVGNDAGTIEESQAVSERIKNEINSVITLKPADRRDFRALAAAKLEAESKTISGGSKERTVAPFVATILTKFCKDNERFAEVVFKTPRTLSDTCREVMNGTGSQISDFEVYRKAVKAYFPNADIHCSMEILVNGAPPTDSEINREPTVKETAANTQRNQGQPTVTTAVATETKAEKIQVSLF